MHTSFQNDYCYTLSEARNFVHLESAALGQIRLIGQGRQDGQQQPDRHRRQHRQDLRLAQKSQRPAQAEPEPPAALGPGLKPMT